MHLPESLFNRNKLFMLTLTIPTCFPSLVGVLWCCSAHFLPAETECDLYRYDRRAGCQPLASDAAGWNQQHRRAGELPEAALKILGYLKENKNKQLLLYRWKLFRGSTSSVYLTFTLCSTVCTVFAVVGFSRFVDNCFFISLKIHQQSFCSWGTFVERRIKFQQSNFVTFCIRRLLVAALSRRWLWTLCQLLSRLYWEANRMKVISLSAGPS